MEILRAVGIGVGFGFVLGGLLYLAFHFVFGRRDAVHPLLKNWKGE